MTVYDEIAALMRRLAAEGCDPGDLREAEVRMTRMVMRALSLPETERAMKTGNVKSAAQYLRVHRSTVYRRMKKVALQPHNATT